MDQRIPKIIIEMVLESKSENFRQDQIDILNRVMKHHDRKEVATRIFLGGIEILNPWNRMAVGNPRYDFNLFGLLNALGIMLNVTRRDVQSIVYGVYYPK